MSKTYTVKQVAEILGYSTNSIYSFIDEGRLKGVRVGKGRFRIPEEELNRVLHLTKKPEIKAAIQTQPIIVEKTPVSTLPTELDKVPTPSFSLVNLHIVDIFDWFVGSAAMVL